VARHLEGTYEVNLGRFLGLASDDRVVKSKCVREVVEPVDAISLKLEIVDRRPVNLDPEAISIVVVVTNVLISPCPSFDVKAKPKTIDDPLPRRQPKRVIVVTYIWIAQPLPAVQIVAQPVTETSSKPFQRDAQQG
jgi:hypothetical protein